MTRKDIQKIQAGLVGGSEGVPRKILKIFSDLLPAIPFMVLRFVPKDRQLSDFEDCEAEALYKGFEFIKKVVVKKPASLEWPRGRWEFEIKGAFKNGIINSIQHILYPLTIPRSLMFSVKKYIDAVDIIDTYVNGESLETSDVYRVAFYTDCRIVPCFKTENGYDCLLNRSKCAFEYMSENDRISLARLIKGQRRSLLHYARGYRKTLSEWISLIKEYKFMAINQVIDYEQPAYIDLDKSVALIRLKNELNKYHSDLFDIYCMSLSDTDLNGLIDQSAIEFPKGWLAHQIRLKYGLDANALASLLHQGDKVINEFRKQHGFLPLQRAVSLQSAE